MRVGYLGCFVMSWGFISLPYIITTLSQSYYFTNKLPTALLNPYKKPNKKAYDCIRGIRKFK